MGAVSQNITNFSDFVVVVLLSFSFFMPSVNLNASMLRMLRITRLLRLVKYGYSKHSFHDTH